MLDKVKTAFLGMSAAAVAMVATSPAHAQVDLAPLQAMVDQGIADVGAIGGVLLALGAAFLIAFGIYRKTQNQG